MTMMAPLGERYAQNKTAVRCERPFCLELEEIHPIGAVTRQTTSLVTASTSSFMVIKK